MHCYCCDRRSSPEPSPCACTFDYCRRCILCAVHCQCDRPEIASEDEGEADECHVVEG